MQEEMKIRMTAAARAAAVLLANGCDIVMKMNTYDRHVKLNMTSFNIAAMVEVQLSDDPDGDVGEHHEHEGENSSRVVSRCRSRRNSRHRLWLPYIKVNKRTVHAAQKIISKSGNNECND